MSARLPGAEPYMPDRVYRRLVGEFPAGCFAHDGCRRCELILGKLVRGKRLADELPREQMLALLAELRAQMEDIPLSASQRQRTVLTPTLPPVVEAVPDRELVCDGLCPDALAGTPHRHLIAVPSEGVHQMGRGRS